MEKRDAKGLTEAEFLEQYARKNYPRPCLTADVAIFSRTPGGAAELLLIRRKNHPFLGFWALPGGFAHPDECIEETAARELAEETGVEGLPLTPVGLFSKPGRDPRGWVVSQAYCTVADRSKLPVRVGDDAAEAAWFRVSVRSGALCIQDASGAVPELAFDHAEVIRAALWAAGLDAPAQAP